MKKLFFIPLAALLLFSCNKDQAAVKKLDGTWNVTEAIAVTSVGSVSVPNDILEGGAVYTLTFNACKLKNDEWCTGSSVFTLDNTTIPKDYIFKVTGGGLSLESKPTIDSTYSEIMTISELSKTEVTLVQVEGSTTTTLKATKQ